MDTGKILEREGGNPSLVEETLGGSWKHTGGRVHTGHGANPSGILQRAVQGGFEGLLDFGRREVGLVIEEIISMDGGFARRVDGNVDGKEGNRRIVVGAVRIGWLCGGSLRVGAHRQEDTKCRSQEEGGVEREGSPASSHGLNAPFLPDTPLSKPDDGRCRH